MTQVDKLRAKGVTGKGLKIAVVDTGIDYKHPALGGCFGEGCLVSFGTDFVGDDYTGFNTPVPDDDPIDCGGHGTHVAGIVAAQKNKYGFTGAAVGATLGAYRVFGCDGSAGNDVLIAAFNQAYQDGADIITASIGGPSGWSEEPWAVAVSRIVDKGVPCTVAAGNEGADGQFYASTAANGKNVAAIASFDNLRTPTLLSVSTYTVGTGKALTFGYTTGAPGVWGGVKLPLVAPSFDTTQTDSACAPFGDDVPSFAGKIVLVRRGSCTFVTKAQNVAAKGGKYMLVYNNVPGTLSIDVGTVPEIVAAGMVPSDTGATWIKSLKAGDTVTLSMVDPQKADTTFINPLNTLTGGALSTFTTWGPTWEMDMKPQFGAPGGNILSTYPLAKGAFAILSGTSMATPLAAGIIALLGEVRGDLNPKTIQALLSSTANPQVFNDGSQFYEFLAPTSQQGAGLIQAYDAAYTTTILEPVGLSFNDTAHLQASLNFTLTNKGTKAVTYKFTNVPAITTYTLDGNSTVPVPFPNEPVEAAASLKFSQNNIKINPGQAVTVDVVPTPPTGVDAKRLPLWSGWVAVNGTDGSSLSIPYQGLVGSLKDQTVLGAQDGYISRSDDTTTVAPVAAGFVFTLPAPGTPIGEITTVLPTVETILSLGSRKVRIDVIPQFKNLPAGSPPIYDFFGYKTIGQPTGTPLTTLPRGSNPANWNGQLLNGKYAPAGKYKVVIHALKIFGDEKKKADYNVAETQVFEIKYAPKK